MKVVLVFSALLATAFAAGTTTYVAAAPAVATVHAAPAVVPVATVPVATPAATHSQYHAQDTLGQYSYGYATADGQTKVETKNFDGTVTGKYSYFDPTGKQVELRYIADKDGFRASGDHLPKQVADTPDLPDDVEDAYEDAVEDLEKARYRAFTYAATPTAYTTFVPKPAPLAYYYTAPYTVPYTASYAVAPQTRFQYYVNDGYYGLRPGFQSYTSGAKPTAYSYYTNTYTPNYYYSGLHNPYYTSLPYAYNALPKTYTLGRYGYNIKY